MAGWPFATSPFHEGELALQKRAGVMDASDRQGRAMIRPNMPQQHRDFFAAQALLFLGSVSSSGQPWASLLWGSPGFASSPDSTTLVINAVMLPSDPLTAGALLPGPPVGVLGLEFATRRRIRLSCRVISRIPGGGLCLRVMQSFGNCPQYIQQRKFLPAVAAPLLQLGDKSAGRASGGLQLQVGPLSVEAAAVVSAADTFLIATTARPADTADPTAGCDVSHRGGKPGFVLVSGGGSMLEVLAAPAMCRNELYCCHLQCTFSYSPDSPDSLRPAPPRRSQTMRATFTSIPSVTSLSSPAVGCSLSTGSRAMCSKSPVRAATRARARTLSHPKASRSTGDHSKAPA